MRINSFKHNKISEKLLIVCTNQYRIRLFIVFDGCDRLDGNCHTKNWRL